MDYAYVGIAYACVLSCVCVRFLGVCRRVHLCAGAAHFSHFFCLLCLLLLPYHVGITPCLKLSSSLYFVAATAQQHSHIDFVQSTTDYACVLCVLSCKSVCVVDICSCVHLCAGASHFSFLSCLLCLLLLPYHVCITPCLKLSSSVPVSYTHLTLPTILLV